MARKRRRLDSITFEHTVLIGDVEIVCEFTGTPDQGDGTGFCVDTIRPLRVLGGCEDITHVGLDYANVFEELAGWATCEIPAERERLDVVAKDAEKNELARSHDD